MTRRYVASDRIEDYVLAHARESKAASRLREETAKLPEAGMQIGADQAAFLALLVRSIGAKRCLEVGTFTGYSALAIASALPIEGRLVCCDINANWTAIARRHWSAAGVSGRIDLRLAPAIDTLNSLLVRGGAGQYDFVFIDADKENSPEYFLLARKLCRPGAMIIVDNVIRHGTLADPAADDDQTLGNRRLHALLKADDTVQATTLQTVGHKGWDGFTIAVV